MSKNYQINYDIKASDLTQLGVNKAIGNLEKLAAAQRRLDKERIQAKKSLLDSMSRDRSGKMEELAGKKRDELYLARYKQLLSRKSYMDKVRNLKSLKGDEEALKKYIALSERKLNYLRSKTFADPSKAYDNTLKELALTNLRNRAETMLGNAINANNRARERAVRLAQREAEQRRNATMTTGAIAAGGAYAMSGAGTYAFKQAMTLEQLGISLRAQFGGDEGNKAMSEMKDYARDTAFTLKEATQLLLGVKIGAANIGIKDTASMINYTKNIGRAILAYGGNQEDRSEIGFQLSQIFMAGTANNRQDLKVIARRGMPIYDALTSMTGKTFKELQDLYGSELPASLIAQAVEFMAKSPQVMRATLERNKSFTQSVETTGEQFGYTAGSFGGLIASSMKLPAILRSVSNGLQDIENRLEGENGQIDISRMKTLSLGQQLVVFGTIVTATTLGIAALTGALTFFGKWMGLGLIASSAAWASAIYIALVDWQTVIRDVNKEGFSGLLKHVDLLVAGLGALAGIVLMLSTGNFVGAAALAATVAGVGAYKYFTAKNANEREDTAALIQSTRGNYNTPSQQFFDAANPTKNMTPIPQGNNVQVQNIINVDPVAGTARTKTSVKSPYDNPIFSEGWAR